MLVLVATGVGAAASARGLSYRGDKDYPQRVRFHGGIGHAFVIKGATMPGEQQPRASVAVSGAAPSSTAVDHAEAW